MSKSERQEREVIALKQEVTTLKQEVLHKPSSGGHRKTLSEEKGAESIPTLVGDANYRVWKFKMITFIAEKYPT
eukprot:362869-Karenia_brevis.AAC.1